MCLLDLNVIGIIVRFGHTSARAKKGDLKDQPVSYNK